MKYLIASMLVAVSLFGEQSCEIQEIQSPKTKSSMQKWLDSDFGLQPYRVNYILPYGVSNKSYISNIPNVNYKNVEAELQVSLMLKVADNIFGLNEKYYFAYTHQAFWQLYINSAPFRESLYNPEAYVLIPIQDTTSGIGLRSVKFAYAHKSNGQPETSTVTFASNQSLGNLSRSINFIYSELRFQHDTLVTDLKFWLPIPEDKNTNDNPDIMDYVGYSSVKFTYFLHDHMFTLMGRGNIATQRGALEVTYSYPLGNNFLYMKLFSGYGESLIDYSNKRTKFSIGFSFSR